jgi:hypothetical protein
VVGVMVSAEDYGAMRRYYAEQLTQSMDALGEEAERNGLTPEILEQLLADES